MHGQRKIKNIKTYSIFGGLRNLKL